MYSNKSTHTVVARLTLWYALICALFCIIIFTVVSVKISHNIRKRIDHEVEAELIEFVEIYEQQGLKALNLEFDSEVKANGAKNLICRLLSPANKILLSSDLSEWDQINAELGLLPTTLDDQPVFKTLYPKGHPLNTRIATKKATDGNILQFGINMRSENNYRRKIQRALLIGSCLTIVLSTLFSWLIARRAMSGVRRVTRAVTRIQKDALNQQVAHGNEGLEIHELVAAFNSMLLRINSLIHEIKEVSDHVAHDLRSPITRMRGITETTLTGPEDIAAYREMSQTILEEIDRLTEVINTTLEISQTESGLINVSSASLNLQDLLKNAVDLFQPVAEDKPVQLQIELQNDPLIFFGDRHRIQRAITNLLDNAIKYTPAGGKITLRTRAETDRILFDISDTGPGVNPAETDRIFERFYREEKSRTSKGNGLGLCLAQSIIHAHNGTITVQNNPNKGCTFTVTLPRDKP